MLNFTKMNGAGNDFVMLDNRSGTLRLDRAVIARLCDRHRGIGADGLLVVEPSRNQADFRMRYYNADGGEAEMCGNGARCFAKYVNRLDGPRESVSFETQAGIISARLIQDMVRLDMGNPAHLFLNQEIDLAFEKIVVHSVNTGVPHAIVMVADDLEDIPIERLGPAIRNHEHFAPKGTNVDFVKELDDGSIAIRTYERGVEAETLACGTGVAASAVIFHELTGRASPIHVHVRGGDTMEVGFVKRNSHYENLTLTGPADFVFDGGINL